MNSRVNEKSLFGLFALFPLTYLCTLSVHWIYRRGFLGFKITTQAARTPGFYTRQDIYYTRESMAVTVHDTAHIINIIHVAYVLYIRGQVCTLNSMLSQNQICFQVFSATSCKQTTRAQARIRNISC